MFTCIYIYIYTLEVERLLFEVFVFFRKDYGVSKGLGDSSLIVLIDLQEIY